MAWLATDRGLQLRRHVRGLAAPTASTAAAALLGVSLGGASSLGRSRRGARSRGTSRVAAAPKDMSAAKLRIRRRLLQLQKQKNKAPQEAEEAVELATGRAAVFTPDSADERAEEEDPKVSRKKRGEGEEKTRTIDWSNPGLNVLERARIASEEGWQNFQWEELGETWDAERFEQLLPRAFRQRRKAMEAPPAIKEHVELHALGNRKLRKLPRGEHRPVHFSGSDPLHNGIREALDDGCDTDLGKMAVAISKGTLRERARSHPAGLRGQRGVFPLAERPEIAFIGASNVGKSSLLNAITCTMKLAEARDEPGVTRSIGWFKCSRLPIDILDLPGYGFAKGADFGSLLTDFVGDRKALRALYVLVDARTGLKPSDWQWLQLLGPSGPEKIFVLTKTDLVIPWNLAKVATMVLEDIQSVPKASQRLIMVSARQGNGMHDLRQDLARRAMVWAKQAQRRAERLAKEEAERCGA